MPIRPQETSIVGSWYVTEGRNIADENTKRIEELRRSELVEVASSADGWDTLLRDPSDGRLWELTYPSSQMHGGGPPTLNALSRKAAASKYGRI
jgi:Immunity protein 27